MNAVPEPRTREPWWVVALKALLLAGAASFYLWPMATQPGLIAGLVGLLIGVLLAHVLSGTRVRTLPMLALGAVVATSALPVGWILLDSLPLAESLGARRTIALADVIQLGLLGFGGAFALRLLAARKRPAAFLEAGFVVGSVAYALARHRNHMISRPRFFADWALTMGYDPQQILMGIGVAVAVLATLMLLRHQKFSQLVSTGLLLLLLGLSIYALVDRVGVEVDVHTNGLGLTDDDGAGKGGKGKPDDTSDLFNPGGGSGDGKGDGKGNGNGGGSSNQPPPPVPVAVAVFHDDYDPPSGLLYFRQQVLSRFDGNRLVADATGRVDRDVLLRYPEDGPLEAPEGPNPDFHTRVPTTMFLLHDHPQPVALSQSIRLEPEPNPAPRRFVAAYSVISQTLNTGLERFLGRPSVDPSWSPETVEHYLAYPDDPRYLTLGDEILREGLDPRMVGDDVAKALVIKSWLENKGFYTRKERHAGVSDPAGDFLFGSLRGYCVHFAHAFVHLMRSQGIAARVALGYAVDNRMRGTGSAVLIMGDRAHAWPEIHVAGVGWLPFDIYPAQSDEQPPAFIDQSLENLLGELARNDPSGGRSADPDKRIEVPWAAMIAGLGWLVLALLVLAYTIKTTRRLRPKMVYGHRTVFIATLDRLADLGQPRYEGESRERYASRLAELVPSLAPLTQLHLRAAFAGRPPEPSELRAVVAQFDAELKANVPAWRRGLALFNPFGWWFAR